MRTVLLALEKQEVEHRRALEAAAPRALPKAVGALTWVLLSREICDWARFRNRRQVSSYTGLCLGVRQSGASRHEGSINARVKLTH
jgi:transposase